MPPYDPKANRPKLVPVDTDDGAPVDALLGPRPDAAPPEPASRAHLHVVPAEGPAPVSVAPAPADPATSSRRVDPKLVAAGAALAALVAVLVVVVRRRG